jgi:hypothetical protein
MASVPESANAMQSAVPAASSLKLKDGILVRVRIRSDVSSRYAKSGDKLEFSVANDVIVGDLICIRRGASAFGHVATVQKKGRMGRGGKLGISVDSVETISGNAVPLRAAEKRQGGGSGVSVIDAVGTLGAPIFVLMKGEDAKIPALTTLAAYVNGEIAMDEVQVRGLQPAPTPPTGLSTVYVLRSEKDGEKSPSIYCGSVEVGHLIGAHYLHVQIPPGEYQFQSPGFEYPVRINAEPDQAYYIHFFANRFLVGGWMVLMEPLAGDDLVAFLGTKAESKADLSKADLPRLRDATPLPKREE